MFETALHEQGKSYYQFKTFCQPPTNFDWQCVAKTRDGYWVGYFNQIQQTAISFKFIPRNEYLIVDVEESEEIQRLKRFSKNAYSVEKYADGTLQFNVLRFGQKGSNIDKPFVFSFKIKVNGNCVEVEQESMWDKF